ncbi:MAG: NfeD family protein [Sedimentisphaerales bacterium]|nr:NfeD family protein [Sedimentisphaerales bacterium]
MIALISELNTLEKFFGICAILGGVFLVIRLVFQFIGGDTDVDADVDVDVDMDTGADVDGGDVDMSFKLLSFQGLTAFFLMFGLVGLALSHQSKVAEHWSILGAVAAGIASVWIIQQVFNAMKKLQSSGTINLQNAVGQEGDVYLNIPAGGTGKVRVSVQDHLKVYDAVSDSKEPIPTGQRIKVMRVIAGNTLVVEKI